MKQYICVFLVVCLCSCNHKQTKTSNISIIDTDTLFERKIPVLTFNDKILQKEVDSIVEKEVNCYYYNKDTTCFSIWRMPTFKTEDTILCISSSNCYDIDFSTMEYIVQDHPKAWRKEDIVYGIFKYKSLSFFCYTSSIKFTNLFKETGDSIRVKNSPLLYVKYIPFVDDTHTQWVYFYRNGQLIVAEKATCEQRSIKESEDNK